ncbi:nitroreductase family protein [Heliorestis convoluta]|uniref:Nitroreductase family protein n=1 Tax=Heliorestis convoluta TaxID=356322 RepID=A0A5Q2N7X5_9FIRM|nr:nitroreductase family protein [Heliorestis convoluta]QGG48360.1 nitroreductase family protein [Heliorestis convoluta]
MAILPAIMKRESKRSYLNKEVPQAIVEELLEALRWAPSCRNYQPWRVTVVQSEEGRTKLASALAPGNEWAAKAPLAVIVSSNPKDDMNLGGREYYLFDCGLAVQNLLLQATEAGLMSHPTAGWKEKSIQEAFQISAEERVLCVIFIGYPGSIDDLDEETKAKDQAPRIRKPLEEWARFF